MVEIYNKCTVDVSKSWNVDSGAKATLSSPIKALMTDNGDGTYSYNFSVQLDGAVTVLVKLLNSGGINCIWYGTTDFTGTPVLTNTTAQLDYQGDGTVTNMIPGKGQYFSAVISGKIKAPTTDTYTIYFINDDGSKITWEGVVKSNHLFIYFAYTDTFTVSLVQNQYYDFAINYFQNGGNYALKLQWSTSTMSQQTIPASAFTTTDFVGSSPFQVTTSCPTGYSGSDSSSPTAWKEICGDGLKVGTEQCDDGNLINGDGWQIDWKVTPNFVWSGGSIYVKDTWVEWTTGFTPNTARSQCIPIWGDSRRVGIETWDDSNTSNGDGWSSTWTIEAGYSWTGGSLTSKDTCVACSAGYYQDLANPVSWITRWGDGLRAGSEAWDDLNTSNGDGCSSTCASIESGYIWTGGSTSSKDTWTKWTSGYYPNSSKTVCQTLCGDGLRAGSEKWDDGNTSSGDGCKSDCSSVESGYACTGGSTTSKDTWTKWNKGFYQNDSSNPTQCVTKCGDGIRAGDEVWDDGNSISGDGWPSDCKKVEDGWAWFGGWFGVTDVWVQWDLGYDPNPDYSSWIGAEVPRDTKAMSAATQAAAYMGVSSNLMLTVFSSSSSSSSNSFGMMNQIQLVILLPLIGAYLPQKIYDYLKSMNASLFNLNFLPTSNSQSTISFKALFDFKQPNSFLFLLQLNSGSAFVNIIDLTTTVLIVVGVEIILLIIYVILRKTNKFQTLKSVMLKIFEMLTFGFYIGVWLETFILFLLVDFSEIHYQNKNGIKNLKSTVMSYVIAALILSFILLALWQWWKSRKSEVFETQKYFVTLVEGFKASWIWRSYWLVFLIRRTLFIAIIFFMEDYKMMVKVSLFVSIQGLYFLYILWLRPQDSVKENLNDFINEIFYLYFVVFLLYFNTEDKWTDTTTEVYFWILMANNFILIVIMLGRYSSIAI